MTAGFIAWVDYSPAERERMRRAIALFKESDTRDELGLGAIRDALADLLFPGTSTIQTRLRYFLFIPWIYQQLDRGRITSGNVAHQARQRELDLIPHLLEDDPQAHGIIGAVSGRSVQRLPSNIYWNGLRTWGLLQLDVMQESLHRRWDEIRERNRHALVADDSGIAPDKITVWDPHMPGPPSGDWIGSATLELTRREAKYLQERMHVGACSGSLLAHYAFVARARTDSDFPWDAADQLPGKLDELVYQARAFSQVMHGAAWLYNLGLCRRSAREAHREHIEEYEASMRAWAAEDPRVFESWEPEELWELLASRGVPIDRRRGDAAFVTEWVRRLREVGPAALADDAKALRLVEDREGRIKGPKSRFHDARARDRWGGSSGTARMSYRWHRVRALLRDLYDGLDREE